MRCSRHSEPVTDVTGVGIRPHCGENGLPRPRRGLAMTGTGILQHALLSWGRISCLRARPTFCCGAESRQKSRLREGIPILAHRRPSRPPHPLGDGGRGPSSITPRFIRHWRRFGEIPSLRTPSLETAKGGHRCGGFLLWTLPFRV